MKKFLAMGAVALVVAIVSQQQASAWVNLNAGVGANLGFQSGGNCLLWGAYRNGQPPGADDGSTCSAFPFKGGCGAPAAAPAPVYAPAPVPAPVTPGQTQSRYSAPVYQTGAPRYPTYNPYYAPNGYRR